ncbi:zinc finger protein [Colletotrichum musicola]|uniref:Zinc finger protein n=1 Tax=Colletotrichum musicola TaxID=2175873 RepID=A0A8H6N8H6_9PEZI|nr:zinc finger protein [Colletotrichum musicola]
MASKETTLHVAGNGSPAAAAITPNPFEEEVSRFKGRLKKNEREYFKFASEEEFTKEIDVLQTKLHSGRRQQNMTKLRSFIEAMVQFGKVIDVYCQTSEIVAFVWGPWKLLLLVADTFSNAFTELLDTYQQLGDTLLLLLQARELFSHDANMARILSSIYKDVLEFHLQAFKYFQQPMLKQLFHATWKTYKTRFSDLIQSLSHHRLLLLGQTTLSEARRVRNAEETRIGDERAERDCRLRRELSVWLQSANTKNDHHRFQAIRSEFPTSGHWLFDKPEFKSWFNIFPPIPGLLWLNGIPGAGKTILSSLIIEEARGLARNPTVLYFYCKSNDKERDNFISIARSLLIQLLDQSPDLIDFFYEKYKVSTEATLSTILDIESLLETSIKNCTSVYIILDGLDECPRDERKKVSQFFRSLVEDLPPARSDLVRCLFVSQDDGVARKDFADITSLKIMPKDNLKDINQYCTVWASKLQEKFELSDAERDGIADRIPESCGGMFLLARLICENLFDQATYEDLEVELEPNTFPKGINDAYDRIMLRISNQATFRGKTNYCLMLLGWLVCSKRPLKWQEIQAAKSMGLEEQTVDMRRRRFREHPKDICGSMVEEHSDGVIDLVHVTAKLADELISDGYYVFMEYAALHWVRHLESGLAGLKNANPVLPDLAESLECFLDLHSTENSTELVVSDRNKLRAKALEEFPFFQRYLQAVVSTRKQLSLFGEMKLDETALDVFEALQQVRAAIENVFGNAEDEESRNETSKLYGLDIFKCSRPSCHHFTAGFLTADIRNLHMEKHLRPYVCPLDGCPTSIIGLTTAKDLEKHMWDMHPNIETDGVVTEFPTQAEIESANHQTKTPEDTVEPAVPPKSNEKPTKAKPKTSTERRLNATAHVCRICSKGFSKRFNLQSHMHSHSNEKPHSLGLCVVQLKSSRRTYRAEWQPPRPVTCLERDTELRSSAPVAEASATLPAIFAGSEDKPTVSPRT